MILELQRLLLADSIRNQAFYHALKNEIRPGSVVLDHGAGTGFLGFLAIRLGASKVIFIEKDPVIELAERIAKKMNVQSKCTFIYGDSHEITPIEKVDILICEMLGSYAFEENIIEAVQDGKSWLKKEGKIIPCAIKQYVIPVISNRIQNKLDIWKNIGFEIPLDDVRQSSLSHMYAEVIKHQDCWNEPKLLFNINFYKKLKSIMKSEVKWSTKNSKKVYGFCLFWETAISPKISTSPKNPQTHWKQVYLPLLEPMYLSKYYNLLFKLKSDTRREIGVRLSWSGKAIDKHGKAAQTFNMDMKKAYPPF